MKTIFSLLAAAFYWFALISPATSARAADQPIYTDTLTAGWEDWSWGTQRVFDHSEPVHSGSFSISATYLQAWAGLYLHAQVPLTTSGYSALRFWVHGGVSGGQTISVSLNFNGSGITITPQANTWSLISLPLASLGSPATITDLVWQDASGGAQLVFFLDDISLAGDDRTPTPTPPPGAGPGLAVDAGAAGQAISPYIYGLNFADEALAEELSLPVNRWGGNATTRYNWQIDTYNTGSDWFFENIANENANPAILPLGSASDQFVAQNLRTGSQTLLTAPLIGWTASRRVDGHPFDCGFKVSRYGSQQAVDPWDPDCGNGRLPNGSVLTGNDPADTSLAIAPPFVAGWIAHLQSQFGAANEGGVRFFALDNEPMLWNETHRDIHPQPASYDEVVSRSLEYAAAIKAADPGAQTLGPVLWGWTAYFYSALDWAPGGDWWNHPQDRLAHGNTPFVEWYLQQMAAYEQQHGVRLLDYLDLHYYPQASGVALSPAGNAETQALRLRSVRSLWDINYVDESWIAEPVMLLPRMRAWVEENYPGTRLAITEYNFGGLEHINGALAQADVLGIFGREGLHLATLWAPPAADEPGAYAFRVYRNYDGQGHRFGEISLPASSADQEQLSIYASRRAADGALLLVVINKTDAALTSPVSIHGAGLPDSAQVYRYSAENLHAIVRQADQPLSSSGFSATFPPESITLLAIPNAPLFLPHRICLPLLFVR